MAGLLPAKACRILPKNAESLTTPTERCLDNNSKADASLRWPHLFSASVDQVEINYWAKIAVDLEVAGDIDSMYYEHARAIALGEQLDTSPTASLRRPLTMACQRTRDRTKPACRSRIAAAEPIMDRYHDVDQR